MNIKQEAELFYKAVTRVSNRVDKADDLTAIIARLEIDLEKLERENIELRKQLKEHFDNPPLKFKELKKNMWIWDNKNKCWLYLFKPLDWEPIKGLRYAERIIEHSAEGYYMDFEKGRFYRNQVEE